MEIAMYDTPQSGEYLNYFLSAYDGGGGNGYGSTPDAVMQDANTMILLNGNTPINVSMPNTVNTSNISTTGGDTWNDNPNNVASEDVVVYADKKKKKTNYWPWVIGGGGLLLLFALSNDNNGRK